jgi:hypothetical protein
MPVHVCMYAVFFSLGGGEGGREGEICTVPGMQSLSLTKQYLHIVSVDPFDESLGVGGGQVWE